MLQRLRQGHGSVLRILPGWRRRAGSPGFPGAASLLPKLCRMLLHCSIPPFFCRLIVQAQNSSLGVSCLLWQQPTPSELFGAGHESLRGHEVQGRPTEQFPQGAGIQQGSSRDPARAKPSLVQEPDRAQAPEATAGDLCAHQHHASSGEAFIGSVPQGRRALQADCSLPLPSGTSAVTLVPKLCTQREIPGLIAATGFACPHFVGDTIRCTEPTRFRANWDRDRTSSRFTALLCLHRTSAVAVHERGKSREHQNRARQEF